MDMNFMSNKLHKGNVFPYASTSCCLQNTGRMNTLQLSFLLSVLDNTVMRFVAIKVMQLQIKTLL